MRQFSPRPGRLFAALVLLVGLGLAASGQPAARDPLALPEPVASYDIAARLDPESHRIAASQRLRWRNTSAQPATELRFHLYLNAFRNSASTYLKKAGSEEVETLAREGWGWIEIDALALAATPAPGGDGAGGDGAGGNGAGGDGADGDLLDRLEYVAPDDGNPDDRTVARLPLPRPVAPGGEIELAIEFTAQLPRVVARTGFKNGFHLVAQWFPKLGVLRADGSWSCHQFHHASEFFADFGDYDVSLTVPRELVVGASGRRESRRENGDGTVTYRHTAAGVHDFAWTAWDGFVERRRTMRRADGLPPVELILLVPPESADLAGRYFAALETSIERFDRWYTPYPYPTLTMVDPPWAARDAGGMEYPTFITTGGDLFNPPAVQRPEGVTVHELCHQYFYGLLASDEFTESYLDEGLTTYASDRLLAQAYGDPAWSYPLFGVPVVFPGIRRQRPLDTSTSYYDDPLTDPIARASWGYLDRGAYGRLTYRKMALTMAQVERTLGETAMERAMRAYAGRFRFRHPTTADLIETLLAEGAGAAEAEAGAGAATVARLLEQSLFGSERLDYAVSAATSRRRRGPTGVLGEAGPGAPAPVEAGERLAGYESVVEVRRLGGMRLPVTVELQFADGRTRRLVWDGEERWVRYRITGPRLVAAEADPDQVHLLDPDRLNNSRLVEADRRAARRWSQRVRFWVQNILESFALLA